MLYFLILYYKNGIITIKFKTISLKLSFDHNKFIIFYSNFNFYFLIFKLASKI